MAPRSTGTGSAAASDASSARVRYDQPDGRWVLLATTLGSALAFIDGTVVNIALPRIGTSLHANAAGLQWTVNGYTLSLAALILLGGSLGDQFGRRRMFVVGISWFAAASLLCGLAPRIEMLIAARVLQGVGGALLTPGALAILEASFRPEDRGKAIGAWSGLAGIAGAIGPFLGGWLVQIATWRLVFFINLPLAAIAALIGIRHVPESRSPRPAPRLDAVGVLTSALALGGISYGFTAWPSAGLESSTVIGPLGLGMASLLGFVLAERRSSHPMLPLELFASRAFTAANLVTFAVYAALGGVFFLVALDLQVVAGFSPLAAGSALFPITVLMLLLSSRAGAVGQRIGPRIPMTLGPAVCAGSLLLLARIGADASYLRSVLPAVVLLGLGLSLTVAPLTATALGSVDESRAGIASGVNNAVARAASLLAVAILPLAAGLGKGGLTEAATLAHTYRTAMLICAGLLLGGAATAFALIPSKAWRAGVKERARVATPVRYHCAVLAPPLQAEPEPLRKRSAGVMPSCAQEGSAMCEHLSVLERPRSQPLTPSSLGCKECLELGDDWVHLRLCMTCGHVGCCDQSRNKHATRHFRTAHHPVIKSFEPGEDWAWCYEDREMADSIPTFPAESPQVHY